VEDAYAAILPVMDNEDVEPPSPLVFSTPRTPSTPAGAAITLRHTTEGGDLVFGDFGIETDDGLESLVYMLLFTDRRADPGDDIPDGTDDPRGWWGETFDYGFGSKLWLLQRSKTTPRVVAL